MRNRLFKKLRQQATKQLQGQRTDTHEEFAWIVIKPARGEFVKHLKDAGIGNKGYYDGSCPHTMCAASMGRTCTPRRKDATPSPTCCNDMGSMLQLSLEWTKGGVAGRCLPKHMHCWVVHQWG